MTDEELQAPGYNPYVAVGGNPSEPVNTAIVVDQVVIMEEFVSFAHAVCYFMGVLYSLNIAYCPPKSLTFEFMQAVLLEIGSKLQSRVQTLKTMLHQ